MRLRNTAEEIGLFSRALHWLMALGILAMLGFGTYIARMQVSMANLWLFGLHKSIGLTLLVLVLIRLVWHRHSPVPRPLGPRDHWKTRAAIWVHRTLYALMIAIPIAGWIGSAATGLDVILFGHWTLPRIAPVSESWENAAFALHRILTRTLAALVLLHVAAALTRRDGTLGRMWRGRAQR